MKFKEYSTLCRIAASLNCALAAMGSDAKDIFKNPKKAAREETLLAYKILDDLLIKNSHLDGKVQKALKKEK